MPCFRARHRTHGVPSPVQALPLLHIEYTVMYFTKRPRKLAEGRGEGRGAPRQSCARRFHVLCPCPAPQ